MDKIKKDPPKRGESLHWTKEGRDSFGCEHGTGPHEFIGSTDRYDLRGYPILTVRTENGEIEMTARWFEEADRFAKISPIGIGR